MSGDRHAGSRGRAPLTRQRILEAALELVDREGAGALTMRRLGSELGVAAMSLYNHVAGREALLDGLSEVMVAGIGIEPAEDDTPRAVLARFAEGIRTVALAHPEAFRLVGMRPLHTAAAFRPVEAALGALRAMGLRPEEAAHGYRALVAFARGHALAEIGRFTFEVSEGGTAEADLLSGSDIAAFPHIEELSPHLRHPDRVASFGFGLQALLDGLEIAARRGAA